MAEKSLLYFIKCYNELKIKFIKMKTIYLIILILFYYNVYSQPDYKVKTDNYSWTETNAKQTTLKIYVTINPAGEPFDWFGSLSGSFLESDFDKTQIHPTNVLKILKDDLTHTTSALLVFLIDKPTSKVYLNLSEQLGGLRIEIPYKNEISADTKKSLYRSALDKGSYFLKFLFSINDAGAKTMNSIGFSAGLYPKLFSLGKSKDFSIYAGGTLSFLYLLKNGNKLSQLNSFYNVNNDEFILTGPDSLSQGFAFAGGGLMAGYKIKSVMPILRISAGVYNVHFTDMKVYDVKNGKSSSEPSLWNFGLEFEGGINLFNSIFVGYTLNTFKISKSQINFINKNYLFHTFSIGIMGI